MLGIYFYLQIIFAVFLVWATTTALYMGIFHAHSEESGVCKKALSGLFSFILASSIWFFMYSWTYLNW